MFGGFIRKISMMTGLLASSFVLATHCDSKRKTQTYLWGNGFYQARPDALLQFLNFFPKKIQNLPNNLVRLEFGEYVQAGIDDKNNLYIWDRRTIDSNLDPNNKDQDYKRQNVRLLASNIKEVKFTTGYIWTVNEKHQVIQYPIIKEFKDSEVVRVKIGQKRQVEPLRGAVQIATGIDHVITLDKKGNVYAMGDDTYGQCGQNEKQRSDQPPFATKRVSYPVKVHGLSKIKKISAGSQHCLALDEGGNLFGWGSNSSLQLSHQKQFSQMNKPLLISLLPIKLSTNLDNGNIIDIASGGEFNMVITENKTTKSCEVFSFGNNLKGQLGIGQIKHLADINRVEALSNYVIKTKGQTQKVAVKQISCGKTHCIALLNVGYVMEWGDNEYGQMGNKKRSSIYTPILMKEFIGKKVVGVFAGQTTSGVIVEEAEEKKEKQQSKQKKDEQK